MNTETEPIRASSIIGTERAYSLASVRGEKGIVIDFWLEQNGTFLVRIYDSEKKDYSAGNDGQKRIFDILHSWSFPSHVENAFSQASELFEALKKLNLYYTNDEARIKASR